MNQTWSTLFSLLACALALALGACLPEGRLKRPLEMTPYERDDGWPTGTPEQTGLDPARVRTIYEHVFDEDEFMNAISLIVVHRGLIVAEGYVRDARDVARRDNIQSCTKSVTSLAFGALRGEGFFPELDAPLSDFVEVRDPDKRGITLEHLLTMRSGIHVDNEAFAIEVEMAERKHVTRWLLDQPSFAEPGERFVYRDMDPQLLGAAVLAETGASIEDAARTHLFEPLGIEDVFWQHDADGAPMAAHALWLAPRELARLGELARNQGQHEGEQLVPADWIAEATRKQVEPGGGLHDLDYGYYFWVVPELDGFGMSGHGGNEVLVLPDQELTLVLTSMPYSSDDIGSDLIDLVDLAKELLAE